MKPTEVGRHLLFNLKRAERAYQVYLDNGQQFIYAKNLKKANDTIINLLTNHNHSLPKTLENDAILLLEHLEIWSEHWMDLAQKQNPELNDEFIFQNKHQFPKGEAQNIINHFEKGN